MQNIYIFIASHPLLITVFFILIIALIILEFIKIKQNARKVSPTEAVRLINREKAVVLDLRPKDTYEQGHIIDAISLPFSDLNTKIKKIEKFKAQTIILMSQTDMECAKASTFLSQNGFKVSILGGGLANWKAAEMPVVKS